MWQQLVFETNREQADLLSDLLSEFGAQSVSLQDSQDDPVFDRLDGELPLWSHTIVSGLWPEQADLKKIVSLLKDSLAPNPMPPYRAESLADQQWERVWIGRYQPIEINHRLWICPVGKQPADTMLPTVYLDPGLAFGTGTHATTHLCLDWLTKQKLQGTSVIDYGCGSGILAIAALKLGARDALGVDIDTQAVDVSRENAKTNAVNDQYTACLPKALSDDLQAEIVLANILAEPLMTLAPRIVKMVMPQGKLVLSGLLEAQVEPVSSCYRHAFDLSLQVKDGWVLLAGPKII